MTPSHFIKWATITVLVVGAASLLRAQSGATTKLEPGLGRYQIVFNPSVRADTFLVDSQTGKTWVATHINGVESDATIWLFRERVDDEEEYLRWVSRQTAKPKN